MAEVLIGCLPCIRPDDPKFYVRAITQTLADYPSAVAQQCCDPGNRNSLVRTWKEKGLPSPAHVGEWCDRKLSEYQAYATANSEGWQRYLSRNQEPEYSDEHRAEMLKKIAEIPGTYFK